jgi:hypothetical protein
VVGIQQQFNINNMAGSNISSSRKGFIGPAFMCAGFRKIGLYFSGTIQTDYYRETWRTTPISRHGSRKRSDTARDCQVCPTVTNLARPTRRPSGILALSDVYLTARSRT